MCCFSLVSYYAWIHDKCIVWCACFRLSSFCPSTEGWPGWVNLSTNWAKHKALLHLSAPMCYQLTNVGTCHMVLWLTVVDTNFFVCRFDHVPVLCQNCSDSVRQDWWAGCPLWMLFCMVSVVFLLIVPLRTLVSSPLSRCTLVVFMQAVTACCNIVSSS